MKNLVRTILLLTVAFAFAKQAPPSDKHTIKSLKINTNHSDYAVSFLPNDKVVFVSPINSTPYTPLDLFFGDVNKNGEIVNKRPLNGVAQNKKISKTGITFTKDFKKVYFSARENKKKSKRNGKDRIFVADVDAKGNWANIKKLPFNNDKYISKEPVLSNDGKKLYFVSNRSSSYGGTDIFVVTINTDGTYSEPKNLGETINTKGDEVTPFISEDNKLYFSSNGRVDSNGGLDVYVSQLTNNQFAKPEHLDVSVNKAHDEFAYITKNGKGYFSSNEKDNYNIYAFNIDTKSRESKQIDNTTSVAERNEIKETRIEDKQEETVATQKDVKVKKDLKEKNVVARRETTQADNVVNVAEKNTIKGERIEDKQEEAVATQKDVKVKKDLKEKNVVVRRETTQADNVAYVAEKNIVKGERIEGKQEEAVATQKDVRVKKDLKEKNVVARRETTQADNVAYVAEKNTIKGERIDDKREKTVTLKETVRRKKQSEEAAIVASRGKQQQENIASVAERESQKATRIQEKNNDALSTQEMIKRKKQLEEEQTIALRKGKQAYNQRIVAEIQARKGNRIQAKKEEAIARKEAIKRKKQLAREQAIAKRKAINDKKIAAKEQAIAAAKQARIEKEKATIAANAIAENNAKADVAISSEEAKQKRKLAQEEAIAKRKEQAAKRDLENEKAIAASRARREAIKRKRELARESDIAARKEAIASKKEAEEQEAIVATNAKAKQEKEFAKRQAIADKQAFEKEQAIAATKAREENSKEEQVKEQTISDVKTTIANQAKIAETQTTSNSLASQSIDSTVPGKYHIKYLETNTTKSDYAVTYLNNMVVFVNPTDEKSRNDNRELFIGNIGGEREITNKKGLKGIPFNKKISKTGVTYSSDAKTVYFSAKKNKKKSTDQLFTAKVDASGNWTDIVKLPFNDKKYATGQPTLSNDGKRLYFASDRPGSYGGTDIYVVNVNNDGTYGEPTNVGDKINTRGNEVTPFITKDNMLYFSSNGFADSQGDLDIYSSTVSNNSVSEPIHLDAPINGINNDFAFIKNNDTGYFSSNRLQGQDNDDIYSFILIEEKPRKCEQEIAGVVKDQETLEVLNDAALTLFDEEGNQIKQVLTDSEGRYKFTLECNTTYVLIASSLRYVKEEHIVNTANYIDAPALEANKLLVKKLEGEPEDVIAVTKLTEGTDGATEENKVAEKTETELIDKTVTETTTEKTSGEKVLDLRSISVHYDFDSSEIRQDDTYELDKIVSMMKASTDVKVQVNAFTDARGRSEYNLALSRRRANAAIDYLVSQGISRSRLKAKGFGETQMVNQCVNGVECSEAAHQMNRRTEFVILN